MRSRLDLTGPRTGALSRLAMGAAFALLLAACGSTSKPPATATSSTSSTSHTASASTPATRVSVTSSGGATSSATQTAASSSSARGPDPTTVLAVDAICNDYVTQIGKIKAPPFAPTQTTLAQLPEVATYLSKTLPIMRAEHTSIADAARSSSTKQLFLTLAQIDARLIVDEGVALSAARKHDFTTFKEAITQSRADGSSVEGEATKLGLSVC